MANADNQSIQPELSVAQDNSSKKAKRTTSDVWQHFTKIGIVDGKEKAKCNGCGKEYTVGGKDYGTSTLRRHITTCVSLPKYKDVGAMMLDHTGIVRARKIDPNKVRDMVAYAIIKHDLPYSFVEYEAIRDVLSYLNPDFKSITRKTAVMDVWNFYLTQKEILKKKIVMSPGRISLTADCWTSIATEGYLCLIAHFVDEKWTLNSKILAFSKMEPPHSGVALAKRAHDLLIEWGIDKKIFSITLDNASANDSMQNLLKQQLNLAGSLICKGEFFHVRCCAHILNLIVNNGLKVIENAIHKIRESIRYVRQLEARMISFKTCVEQVGGVGTAMGLKLDVPTRWNSTHAMLTSAIRYRRVFAALAFSDSNFHHCPTNEEWARAEVMCSLLKPFVVITNFISGSTYPTSNMYFSQISKIEVLLKSHMHHDDPIIQDMAVRMLEKFDKYWSDYSIILALAIILDPRMKLDIIKFTFAKLDPANCSEKVEHIRSKLYCVFDEYKDVGKSAPPSSNIQGDEASCSYESVLDRPRRRLTANIYIDDECNYMEAFDEDYITFKSQNTALVEKSELDSYLEESTLDPRLSTRFNILEYWRTNSARFPCLSKMACDILSIPITTVASESAFSIGSRVLTKYRSCLLPTNVQALICTRNWLLGFPWTDIEDVEEEEKEKGPLTISDKASNIIIEDN